MNIPRSPLTHPQPPAPYRPVARPDGGNADTLPPGPSPLSRTPLAFLTVMVLLGLAPGCASSPPTRRTGSTGAPPPPRRSDRFIARGLATYYGARYQGRPTASGERFDKEALTAAHENLPFGRRVRVTNTENGRSVVVRINDRFKPFKGRIIDLSERAFREIAPLERGVIPVMVEEVP